MVCDTGRELVQRPTHVHRLVEHADLVVDVDGGGGLGDPPGARIGRHRLGAVGGATGEETDGDHGRAEEGRADSHAPMFVGGRRDHKAGPTRGSCR